MPPLSRRKFLDRSTKTVVALSGGAAALAARKPARAAPASEKIVLASIGLGGRGSRLTGDFAARPDCELAYLCDLDPRRGGAAFKDVRTKPGLGREEADADNENGPDKPTAD